MSSLHHDIFRNREFATFLRSRLYPRPPPALPIPPLPTLPRPTQTQTTSFLPPRPPPPSSTHDPLILLSSPFTFPPSDSATPPNHALPIKTPAVAAVPAFTKRPFSSARKRPRDAEPDPISVKRRIKPQDLAVPPNTSPTAVANHLPGKLPAASKTTLTQTREPMRKASGAGTVDVAPSMDLPSMVTRSSEDTEGVEESHLTPGFDCELCDTRFFRKHHLERHIQNIHEGQRPWTCDICGFAFHQKPNLERHIMTVHEEQRPYRCHVCEMSFGRKGVLKKHIQMVHEHSRKFACDICKISFGLKSDLKRHVQSVHQKKRPFVCNVCSASFGRKSDLKRHTLSLHPGAALPATRNSAPSSAPAAS